MKKLTKLNFNCRAKVPEAKRTGIGPGKRSLNRNNAFRDERKLSKAEKQFTERTRITVRKYEARAQSCCGAAKNRV